MTLPLSRIDYATVGVTSRGTTKIFPATEHRHTQKFAVADHDGILYVYGKLQFFYIQNNFKHKFDFINICLFFLLFYNFQIN